MTSLNILYKKGLIVYPRTESDYISEEKLLSYLAHPKLNEVNDFCLPLKRESYKMNFDSFILHLHNKRILSPSNFQKSIKTIKNFYFKEESFLKKIEYNYNNFLDIEEKLDKDYFINDLLEHYRNKKVKLVKIQKDNFINFDDYLENKKQQQIIRI